MPIVFLIVHHVNFSLVDLKILALLEQNHLS